MKNLLNVAIEGLIERMDNELQEVKYAINELERVGDKVNMIYDRRENILGLVDRVHYLEDQLEVRFPEDNKIEKVEKEVNKRLIQLEDLLNVIYNC